MRQTVGHIRFNEPIGCILILTGIVSQSEEHQEAVYKHIVVPNA